MTTEIEYLITGFFTDSLNEDEMKRLIHWLDEDALHRKEFGRLRSSWIMAGYESGKKSFNSGQGWLSIGQKIKPERSLRLISLAPLWYAASLMVCIALGAVIALYTPKNELELQATRLITTTTISAPLGAKSNITLPDGSRVWLNAGSEIQYSSDFGNENRDLQLTGEAFFDVKSDSLKPFNVHATGMIVKALGTRFNVKAYPDDITMVATLETGAINVEIMISSGGTITSRAVKLKPKEQLVVQKNPIEGTNAASAHVHIHETSQEIAIPLKDIKEMVIASNVQTELSTSWKDKKWIISDEPLALFAENLERRYNLQIRLDSDELKAYNFSGSFENETVEQILTALSLAAPINYKLDKNNVVLSLNQKNKEKFNKILKSKN